MRESWGNHGGIMGESQLFRHIADPCVGESWGNHGGIMGESWGNHGEIMGKSWGNHGEIIGKSWGNHLAPLSEQFFLVPLSKQ